MLIAAIPLPLVLRHRVALPRLLVALRPHYVLGYLAAGLAIAHSVLSITRRPVPLGAEIGLWLGSAAALALVVQVITGRGLREAARTARGRLRTFHLVLMIVVLVLIALHVALNGPLPH